mmetsp:Transcript_127669/g.272219  ORF Transcript_127669/g.272219 Transcript_127669/m.272219 type:complete len:637 (+) Transcript_127669:64-1974(+)
MAGLKLWTGDPCLDVYPQGYWIEGGRHSGSYKETELTIMGTNLSIKLPIRVCTTVAQVKQDLAQQLGLTDPGVLHFVVKQGCSFRDLVASDQMHARVKVRGIKSWTRERLQYASPLAIIGAGHCGLRHGLECLKQKFEDFVVFERWNCVGGDAWLVQANQHSKLQTELGTYHLQYDDIYTVPRNLPSHPTRDQLLQHFAEVTEEKGLMAHIRLESRVVAMQLPPKSRDSHLDPDSFYKLEFERKVEIFDDDGNTELVADSSEFCASAVVMSPGNLTKPKQEFYPGEHGFSGHIGYGMFNDFDYSKVNGQNVAVVGMGAFSVENLRTCLEHSAKLVYLVCRRKNLVMPRMVSWFINQTIIAPSAADMLNAMEPFYNMVGDDPWQFYAVSGSKDHSRARISQKARFPISDVHFLALYYGKAEVVLDAVKRLTSANVVLQSGRKLEVTCMIKALGFMGSEEVDKIMHVEDMIGYWPQADCRRWLYSESPGVDFSRISSTTLSPGAIMMVEVGLHFIKFPKDFGSFIKDSTMPKQKKSPERLQPVYVVNALDATAIGMILGAQLEFIAKRGYDFIKRKKQHECHPLGLFLDEMAMEWKGYCKMFSEELGSSTVAPPYPFSVASMTQLIKDNDKALQSVQD